MKKSLVLSFFFWSASSTIANGHATKEDIHSELQEVERRRVELGECGLKLFSLCLLSSSVFMMVKVTIIFLHHENMRELVLV